MAKRINRAIELLEGGQAIYYDGPHTGHVLTYEQGRKDAKTWADYINVGMEHGAFDMTGLGEYMRGLVDVELTDISEAQIYLAGRDLSDKPLDATVTTRARIIPNQASGAPCGAAVSSMTAKKLMRAHAIF